MNDSHKPKACVLISCTLFHPLCFGLNFVKFHNDLILPLRKYTLEFFLAFHILQLIFVKLNLSDNSTPDVVLYLGQIAFVQTFEIPAKSSFVEHLVQHCLEDCFLDKVIHTRYTLFSRQFWLNSS